jgi:hypothetical protein
MFNPSREEIRDFLFESWRKFRAQEPLIGLEAEAAAVIAAHPEYHSMLSDRTTFLDRYRERDYPPEFGETNPFLHLSMHLSIREQVSIDQPRGVKAVHDALSKLLGSGLLAEHEMMECLAEMIWQSQRNHLPPDAAAYVRALDTRVQAHGKIDI